MELAAIGLIAAGTANLAEREIVSGGELDGEVSLVASEAGTVACRLLQTSDGSRLRLQTGDRVLVWTPADSAAPPIILGRIGAPAEPAAPAPHPAPDELVIEAKQSLTLRVGGGSITIREDGRILIKGRELVSHAKGMNRIRGGSVAIN